jgi:predicted nucleic acid-binding protein
VILADTSVWINYFRAGDLAFAERVSRRQIAMHPFVLGELACGTLPSRARTIADMRTLPMITVASDDEVMHVIESRRLHGTGMGWTDVHLLASAMLAGVRLVTRDRALASAARGLGVLA